MAFRGAIFDVDGVLVDSPHELAWREAFRALMDGEWRDIRDQTSWTAERFTPAVYQQVIAGMPRMAGARAAMEYFGVPDIDARIEQYAAGKQQYVIKLIEQGRFMAFPDALRFILAVKHMGIRVAAASSSKRSSASPRATASSPRTRPAGSRRPRRPGWSHSAWPGWTTGTCCLKRAPIWW
jgi:beta-phosphoglucomutase